MTQRIEFLFDFGSPNAYLAYKAIQGMDAFSAAEIEYSPVLLGGIFKMTGNQPPMLAYGEVPAKMKYLGREIERFQARHKLTDFTFNPHFPVNTLTPMRAALVAREEDCLDAYLEVGFHHMWEAGSKLDDPEVFVAAMNAAGLDGQHLLERSKEPAIKKALIEATKAAVERDIFGIPSFFVDGELYFGKETLWEMSEALTPA